VLQALEVLCRRDGSRLQSLLVAGHPLAHLVDVRLELVLLASDVARLGLGSHELGLHRLLLLRQTAQLSDLRQGASTVLEVGKRLVDRLQVEQSGLFCR
jgi:hypothetical protein